MLTLDGRPARLRGNAGARLTADLWWEPTRSLMLQYAFSVVSIGPAGTIRAAAGWRLFDRFWIGPELSLVGDQYGQQYRIGAHLTGLRTGTLEWSVGAGYERDGFQRDGIYGRLGFAVRPERVPFFE